MMAKLKAGASGYDVVFPSDYVVATMVKEKLLQPLNFANIPNASNLAPEFKAVPYDPEGKFVVPYMFGTTGLLYNSAKIPNPPRSWKAFFSAEALEPLGKRVSLLDDAREVLGAAMKSKGLSLNTTDPAAVADAKTLVQGVKAFVGRFDTMSYKDLVASGDLWLAHSYSGEANKLKATMPEIEFLIPEEGGTIWADNMAVPANAPNKDLAEKFINYLMRPEVNAKLSTNIRYATANGEARKLLPAEEISNPNVYPTAELRERLEWFDDLGDATEAFDNAWTELRAGEVEAAVPGKAE
jgi:spermidine/putrescine-binding protein